VNRHSRRSDMRIFRRADLLTHMIAVDDVALEDHPLLKNAVANFHAGRGTRKLLCPACKAPFADDGLQVAAYLFAMPVTIDGLVSTSGFCSCVAALSIAEVDAVCTRVLRALAPGGQFLDPP
jgi:hypothetical protein